MIELLSSQGMQSRLEKHFGLRDTPFGVTPDPRFFYANKLHLDGLRALAYGIQAKKGFLLVTGEVGTGKTILIRKLMRHLESTVKFVFVSASQLTSFDPIELLVRELRVHKKGDRSETARALDAYLIEQVGKGHTVALLIDEAQKLSDEALESLCDLSNLETDEVKLIQIVLVGQPELTSKLSKSSLRRLKQRMAMHYRLGPLQNESELGDYIHHRLRIALYEGPEIFTPETTKTIWCYSHGIPRLVNVICDNALALACEATEKVVSPLMVARVAVDLLLERAGDTPKTQASELGSPKLKTPTPGHNLNGARTNGIEAKPGDALARPIIRLRAAEEPSIPRIAPKETPVPQEFLDRIRLAAIEAMGPMARMVVFDQISALGESYAAFPQTKLEELIQSVSREISNKAMRARFENLMSRQISTLKTL
jgi:type II secretory pathway predicted ATPase ExeA